MPTFHICHWQLGTKIIADANNYTLAVRAFDNLVASDADLYELDDVDPIRIRRYLHIERRNNVEREKTDSRSGEESAWQSR